MRLYIRVLVVCVAGRRRGGKGPKLRSAEVLGGEEVPYRDPPASNLPAPHALAFPLSLPFGRLSRRLCSGSENYNRNRKCRKCPHNLSHGCRSLRESTDFLTALLFYDFLYFLSCWLVAMADMAVLKAIVSLYLAREEEPIARFKTRVKVAVENNLFSSFLKNISEFLGPNEQAQKFVSRSFDPKFYRLTKINGRITPYQSSSNPCVNLWHRLHVHGSVVLSLFSFK